MKLDFNIDGKLIMDMVDYVEEILDDAPPSMTGEALTPAPNHLFDIRDDCEKLNEEEKRLFHFIVAKSLFLCKRGRPDIQTAISFLCTRVKNPDFDDWKKLGRLIKYLRATKNLKLTVSADDAHVLKWWVDGSYATHPDMKSHTGGTLSLGKGCIYNTSMKQKINTKSSTEAELVAMNDVLPQVLWTKYFLEAQGYGVNDNIVYQDNLSAILLEKNGKWSSTKRTKHLNVRYFFVTDKISNQELTVKHCGTENMVGDFYTKPLQGSAFRKLRKIILNIEDDVT